MRLCQSCSLKDGCKEICETVQTYLFENKGYSTTYTNREASSLIASENRNIREPLSDYLLGQYYFSSHYSRYLPLIRRIVATYGTPIQQTVFDLWMNEQLDFVQIAEELHISKQSAYEMIHGHSKHGGGLIRKIKKHLRKQNYLT